MKTSAGIDSASTRTALGLVHPLLRFFLGAAACCVLASCDSASPRTSFEHAVLNSNMIADFASDGLLRQLASPSEKLTDVKTGASAPMKRKEVIDDKIAFVEKALEKIRNLSQSGDAKEMVQASIALHEYVLPVYRTEYQQLAKLYDDGASKGEIAALSTSISSKYGPGFAALYDQVITAGKAYAAKHDIKVTWDIRTSPSR